MLKKMMLIPMLLLLCFVCIGVQKADAASWATVSIDMLGANITRPDGRFTDTAATPTFTNQYLRFDSTNSNQLMAAALTAFSLGKNIAIRIKDDGLTIDIVWVMAD